MVDVFLAGHLGMVGSAVHKKLEANRIDTKVLKRSELDLTNQAAVYDAITSMRPKSVIIAAARVGGILANRDFPADFIHQNLVIQSNLIHGSYLAGVEKLIFLGSSCIYPKYSEQPIKEEYLLSGALERTNEPYAIAKIAGVKMCDAYRRQYDVDYRSVMPTNLYGPGDNFDLLSSHVLPALLRKFHDAKTNNENIVSVWGSGKAKREFLYVEDLAEAIVSVYRCDELTFEKACNSDSESEYPISHINIGTGIDCAISELASLIGDETGFTGTIEYDKSKPDGTPRKLLDVSRINQMGWTSRTSLQSGIRQTYQWFRENC